MSDKMNEAIQDIAVIHGVVIGKDDPILILHTMNEKLLEENKKAQQVLLAGFKKEMEHIATQWQSEASVKAEKILNQTLANTKEIISRLLKDFTKESMQTTKILSETLAEARNLTQIKEKFSRLALLTITILTSSCLFLLFFIIHVLK